MEYPHLGKHCSKDTCRRFDFLPVKCDACEEIFCSNHMSYTQHNCPSAYKKNVQVPVCPLCSKPVPTQRGVLPDIAVSQHIDNDCQSNRAQQRRKVFTNRCSAKGCKTKEIVPVLCGECLQNYCFKHRHFADHECSDMKKKTAEAALLRHKQNGVIRNSASSVSSVQGTMSEDEALARALQMSMQQEKRSTRRPNDTRSQSQPSCRVS